MKKQRLELTWIGKDDRQHLEPRILIEEAEKGFHAESRVTGRDQFENRLIFGDNLLALKALEAEFAGQVKCIYIDPPYNTGSAFTHYDDGLEHSTWLSLMRDRLEIIYRLLHPADGSLWVSIDDYEAPYLRILLDEIFGRDCFIASNVWQKRYSRENREAIGDVHEYVLTYAMNPSRFKAIRNKVPPTPEQTKVYRNPNSDPRGPWRPIPMTAQEGHATKEQFYEITSPSGAVFVPPKGRCWGLSKATFERLRSEGRIYFGKNGDSQPNVIRYLSEVEGYVPWTWWPHDEVGHTDESKKEIHALFGKTDAFDTPKPERLIKRILEIATNPGDLVLDSFAGSGTTGAVAHKMLRRWIMVESGEHCDTLIVPRLNKVISGQDAGGITEAVNWKGGGGYRYFRLAPSLLGKDRWGNWVIQSDYNPEMLAEAVCKLMGFSYAPSEQYYWMHGYSSERDFIFVTTQSLTQDQLRAISEEVGDERSLLVCCKAFSARTDSFENLTIKKIPLAVLRKCEWGRDDYSLAVRNLPNAKPAEPSEAQPTPEPKRRALKQQADLFAEKG
ncbi:site-specific DNA-methyltransferase [Burkholderia pyrrocinia]|uniref:site-specific DNA-methyltransferase n=1 Tax=Burkholderia pyrrocinia TaxID=60550 RepID=UPI00104C47DF|nr:site-specific DNA-methyltransferase [Burkholderia pyrrocinia]TDA45926.1 site-specific DNA-methyltransferase [Burkholderia pyrrocinia]